MPSKAEPNNLCSEIVSLSDEFKKLAEKGKELGKEIHIAICRSDRGLSLSDEPEIGEEHSVTFFNECYHEGEETVGFIHTHPSGRAQLSTGDFELPIANHWKMSCVCAIDEANEFNYECFTFPSISKSKRNKFYTELSAIKKITDETNTIGYTKGLESPEYEESYNRWAEAKDKFLQKLSDLDIAHKC